MIINQHETDLEKLQYRDNVIVSVQVDCNQSSTDARIAQSDFNYFSVKYLEVWSHALPISHFVGKWCHLMYSSVLLTGGILIFQ